MVSMSVVLPAKTLGTITIPAVANPEFMTVKVGEVVVWSQGDVVAPTTVAATGSAIGVRRCSLVNGAINLDVEPGIYTLVATTH